MTEATPPTATRETITLEGLKAPASIVVDRWGVPHLRAESEADLWFIQGFNAARDRLWQIDLWRKRGLGLLAADFGPGYLAQDRAARLFLYRGDMDAEFAAYAPDARAICGAFAAGINAYVDLCAREPERLPPEFAQMGTRPAHWAADDVVRIRTHTLTRNALSEVIRAIVLARADLATDLLRKDIEPMREPIRPEGLDLGSLEITCLDTFKLATAAVTFSPERLAAPLEDWRRWTQVADNGEVMRKAEMEGSNNWAVHGSRTESGRPILASDPHRAHAAPGLRYIVHLEAPGFNAIGAGEPAVPGISIGHNGTAAFALTIHGADQEDVMVYETIGDGSSYRYGDGYEPMIEEMAEFTVMGQETQSLPLRFTRHGPIIAEAPGRAVAVRTVWSLPGSAPYLRSLTGMRATTLEDYAAAMRGWGTPSVNQIYADTSGTIAWMPAGYAPQRPNWDGLLPMPGDGRYEWSGLLDPAEYPTIVNPPEGFVASANELNLPADWPHEQKMFGFEWTEASRARRIREVLGRIGINEQPLHRVEDSAALQTDVLSIPARRLCALLLRLPRSGAAPELWAALTLLEEWDHQLRANSAAAALFEVFLAKFLKPRMLEALVPDASLRPLLLPQDNEALLRALEQPDSRFGTDPAAGRDALLASCLTDAFRDCEKRMGSSPSGWEWGKLHHGYFQHALSGLPDAPAHLDVGPLPVGGSASTPMHTGYRPSDFRAMYGASVRLVMDVGEWDKSIAINAPGQSGDPRSPHYADLAPSWSRGAYVPLLYSREAVDAMEMQRIELIPG
ncbi:penicillin acylase family protein [Pseudoroseomonas wenyumeiae]|uniref:Penicillin acylase family protein n=1 Tax=Teichococcus wenyumeiae TaxID=2478470 RepID=A0A3A9JP45_9PROT|nr:penicillin acylase family protein [Pseudoroseomonas wenyumeiae]RKK05594.1 penicillin acylase family protein [Pseudoroseomonas wenyumeiae]RMI19980.1 penicillin acylase family protein [Pseudoroseomonas wenyumeiae]